MKTKPKNVRQSLIALNSRGQASRLFLIIALVAIMLMSTSVSSVYAKAGDRFEDMGDSTVVDSTTGLMWVKDANLSKRRIPLQSAKEHITNMNAGTVDNFGHTDWRLPSIREMVSLMDKGEYYPSIPAENPFLNVQSRYGYWSSDIGYNIVGYVWVADFAIGEIRYDYISYCNFQHFWPVRDTKLALGVKLKERVALHISPSDLELSSTDLGCDIAIGGKAIAPPTAISATAVSPEEIVIAWKAPMEVGDIAWYNIYDGDEFSKSSPERTLTFKGYEPNTQKCFSVSSFSLTGLESPKSIQVCATTWQMAASGTVWSEGKNSFGQLGDGSRDDGFALTLVKNLSDVKKIAAGVEHAVAVKNDGTVWTWGRNNRGQLGDGTTRNKRKPIKIEGLSDVVDVAAGWYHTLALKADGTVWAWGRNYYGQLGDGRQKDSKIPVQVKEFTGVKKISAGWYHSMAIKEDGTVWNWGWNIKGQLGVGDRMNRKVPVQVANIKNAIGIDGGMYHSLVVTKDGTVWAWGWNEYGQLGDGTKSDLPFPVKVKAIKDVVDVSGGTHFSIAVKSDGTVWAWGRNEYGQLGGESDSQVSVPIQVKSLSSIKKVTTGANHAMALHENSTVMLWGWDYGKRQKSGLPRLVSGIGGISEISAGTNFSILLKQ